MAHSGGTSFGIQVAARAPELYHAYIGIAQMAYQPKSEQLAYEYMLKRFEEVGDKRMVRKLEEAVPATGPLPLSYMRSLLRDDAMHRLGIGTTHDMKSIISGVLLGTWQCREYTFGEKINLWRGKSFSSSPSFDLWNKTFETDITAMVPKLNLPVYFFHGVYDYTVNYSLTKDYFDKLQAPLKGFYTFEHSAHSPLFEEPERMRLILREDVLVGANALADRD
ncbi:MAG: putative hydrolase or acyltransferase of alpha/beta superfamily [Symbiobacteriaceae bacterium]|jgi:pimeloyl-ACP methyl ester carboxylesterase|nr:putative hydrolase or acyltransferase of alpha/beta superfamily [Symbiobacteriaceae bacterium]